MRADIKRLDSRLSILLWVAWFLLLGVSYYAAVKMTAPEYEITGDGYTLPYSFDKEDGDRVDSEYQLAWYHKFLKSPKAVFYDPEYDKSVNISDKYYHRMVAQMDDSEYNGIVYHAKWIWFGLFIILSTILVAIYGDRLRDRLVCNKIKECPDFLSCTSFINSARSDSTKKEIQKLIPFTASGYIFTMKKELENRFSPLMFNLVMGWLEEIKNSGSTTIFYKHKFVNQLEDQLTFLNDHLNFYIKKRGIISNAETIIDNDKKLLKEDYVSYPELNNKSSYTSCITAQLNDLFTEIMGSNIFNFKENSALAEMGDSAIEVSTVLRNSTDYWNLNNSGYSGKKLPGINISVSIDKIKGSTGKFKDSINRSNTNESTGKVNLWSGLLWPKLDYQYKPDEFNLTDCYCNMIVHTMDTLSEQIKKNK